MKGILQMKLITKLLIITLLALSFFMTEPKSTIQSHTGYTVASDEDLTYEQIDIENTHKTRSIDIIRLM